MCKYIFSVLMIIGVLCVRSQSLPNPGTNQAPTNTSGKPATMKEMRELRKLEDRDWSMQYLKVSYDLIPAGRTFVKPTQKGQEIQISSKFYKYITVLELGFQDMTRERSHYKYNSSGGFFRIGAEVNLLKPNEQNGVMTFGFRYARCGFEDRITYTEEESFGGKTYSFKNANGSMGWLEMTAGLNLVMSKNIHMGYLIRFKFLRNVNGVGTLEPFDIPGFGRFQKENNLGFSYYIGWSIPFKEMKKPSAN